MIDDVTVEVASIENLNDAVNMANSDPSYRIVVNLTHNISGISREFVLNESKLVIVLNGYTISGTVSGDNNRPGYIFKSVGADLTIQDVNGYGKNCKRKDNSKRKGKLLHLCHCIEWCKDKDKS